MNTLEINNSLKKFKTFLGAFPKDKLPKTRKPCGLIINTDSSNNPGEHWVAIYTDNNCSEYFDSFGLPPLQEEI